MADKYWLSDVTAAWDTGAAWTGGAKPGAGDNAIFTGAHVGAVTKPAAPETVTGIYIMDSYTGLMGTVANPLTVDAARLVYKGAGDSAYFTSTISEQCVVETVRTDAAAFNLIGTFGGGDSLVIVSGRANISGSGGYGPVIVGRGRNGNEPILDIASGVTLQDLFVDAGRVTGTDFEVTNDVHVSGGYLDWIDPGNTLTTFIVDGGLVRLSGTVDVTIATGFIMHGSVDASALKAKLTVATNFLVGKDGFANLDNGRPAVGTAGYWVSVLPGGRLQQSGTGLAVQFH